MRHLMLLLALAASAAPAHAHLVSARFGEYYSGLLHPAMSLSHVLAWLALAAFAGLRGPAAGRGVLMALPLAVLAGALAGSWGPLIAPVAYFNTGTLVALGLLLALAPQMPSRMLLAVAVVAGLSHGYANAAAELAGGERLLYAAGVASAAYVVTALAAAAALMLSRRLRWGAVALRALGSWVAAVGLMVGAATLMYGPDAVNLSL